MTGDGAACEVGSHVFVRVGGPELLLADGIRSGPLAWRWMQGAFWCGRRLLVHKQHLESRRPPSPAASGAGRLLFWRSCCSKMSVILLC